MTEGMVSRGVVKVDGLEDRIASYQEPLLGELSAGPIGFIPYLKDGGSGGSGAWFPLR